MSKKSNVHPDYYKTAGRDRQDDAAAARQARAIALNNRPSPERGAEASKTPWFRKSEPASEPTRAAEGKKNPASRRAAPKAKKTKGKTARAGTNPRRKTARAVAKPAARPPRRSRRRRGRPSSASR